MCHLGIFTVELEVLPQRRVSAMTNNCWKGYDNSSNLVITPQTTAGGNKTEMGGQGIGLDLQAQLRTPGCKLQRVENLAKEGKEKGPVVSLVAVTISKTPPVPLEE